MIQMLPEEFFMGMAKNIMLLFFIYLAILQVLGYIYIKKGKIIYGRAIKKKIKAYSIKNNNNRILKNYYSKEMRKGKTYRASFVDKFFLFLFFLFIFLTIILTVKSGYLILSIYVSGIILFLLFNCFKGISKQKKEG